MAHAQIQVSSDSNTSVSVRTWPAILTIVLFFLSNAQDEAHGHAAKRVYAPLNFITVPLVSVLVLLAAGVFDAQTVRDGVLGTQGVKPLDIMALFISLAYISISLDATGLLRFLAFWVARKGGADGRRLYAYLYLFFLVCGVVVGNDPVILSGTAFLAYFTRVAGITPPTAWILAQFAAANMASVVLVSSNPTNLVLSGAFSLSFLTYAGHVALPFLAAALSVFPLLLFLFRSRAPTPAPASALIPRRIAVGLALTPAEVRASLVDPQGALFGSVLLLGTLTVLVGVSTRGVRVWMVTVPPAVVMLVRDLWYDWARRRGRVGSACGDAGSRIGSALGTSMGESSCRGGDPPLAGDVREGCEDGVAMTMGPSHESHGLREMHSRALPSASTPTSGSTASAAQPPLSPAPASLTSLEPKPSNPTTAPPSPAALLPRIQHLLALTTSTFPTVTHIAARLPVALLPFALLMFVLVQGLAAQGWVALFARWWGAWVRRTGVRGAVGGMGVLACLLCNFCGTNIGATILLARVLQLWLSSSFQSSAPIDPRARDGAIYALALASNFGAFTLTFGASLAGLLWREILRQKGIRVRAAQFLVLNLPVSFVAMLVGCAVLVGQTYVEHRGR
ncbi:hypothetical protein C8Q70DRAFT_1073410 [Cubamyces menziesii]|nr:hypothetical protein C8Q70DRAFT_1073410 [Cubamyces menziesii]